MRSFCKYDELLTGGLGEQEGVISSLTFGVVLPPSQGPASNRATHVLYLLYPNRSRSLPIAVRCIFHTHIPPPAHPSILPPCDLHIAITASEGLRRLCFSSSASVAFIVSHHPLDRTSASSPIGLRHRHHRISIRWIHSYS